MKNVDSNIFKENDYINTIIDDYSEALVRIASMRGPDKKNYLIFAWVELYPFDMSAPEGWNAGKRPWSVPGYEGASLGFSATRVATREALEWYSAAAAGKVLLPGKGINLISPELAPEPAIGRFVVGRETPFTHFWHDGPRINQLVALKPVSNAVQKLKKIDKAGEWLIENLGFNTLNYDEWIGSVALVAPDPVCASFGLTLDRSPVDDSENLFVQTIPRRTVSKQADLSTLTVLIGERRAGAWADLRIISGNNARFHHEHFVQPMRSMGHAVICSKRGLLRMCEPAPWLRSINTQMSVASARMQIEVPAGGRRKPEETYEVTRSTAMSNSTVGESPSDHAAQRLGRLIAKRKHKSTLATAPQVLFGSLSSPQNEAQGPALAQEAIVDLITTARKRIIFVDPFFGIREMRLFALRNPNVPLKILTGWPALELLVGDARGFKVQQGAAWGTDLRGITQQYKVEVRVMPGKEKPDVHDRYLIIDWKVWHCGPSFNELGSRLGAIMEMPNPVEIRRAISKIWCRSEPLTELFPKSKMLGPRGEADNK